MDKKNPYDQPPAEVNPFFARRVRHWVLNPEKDEDLTEQVKAGKYPALEILLEDDE